MQYLTMFNVHCTMYMYPYFTYIHILYGMCTKQDLVCLVLKLRNHNKKCALCRASFSVLNLICLPDVLARYGGGEGGARAFPRVLSFNLRAPASAGNPC